ncbi:zinc finger SWIM domain-containing protein 8 isoform 3-T3 [Molossus nigricans]|uniref:zinc finger SWIM domain-containing protein 8 isoform X2 n=1 Tax=Molossus molossus TaxID=27622 RepID=UPI001746AAD6|nr:zinc finger SWIM domain-containing protein 8 isoform X2 [Molossus molossus]
MELMFAEWEDGERFSFEDSDRFEEDSLCSFISEAESLCQNWRGWRKQSAGPNSPTGGGGGGGSGGTRMRDGLVIPLVELSAKQVAFHIPFEVVEKVYPPVPEQLQLRIAFWSFPENEEDIRLYSCLANGSADEFQRGDQLFRMRAVKDPLQIGFHLSATVVPPQMVPPKGAYNVAVMFDRCRVTSCSCTCGAGAKWCTHVVALCLFRIHNASAVCLRAPVSESLSRLQRDQLQKFAQYLISELPQQILPTAQRLLDELLSSQSTAINTVCGAPDPTAGPSASDQSTWYLDESTLTDNIKKTLHKFCGPSPVVFSDVNSMYLSSTEPPAAAEWACLLRPLRGREPEGVWNLLSIVREMFKRRDSNAAPLLEILTDQCLTYEQITGWWYSVRTSASHSSASGHTGRSNGQSEVAAHACASMCDEMVTLWRLAVLDPALSPQRRRELCAQLRQWQLKVIENVKRGQHKKTLERLFPGFRPAVEACYFNWEEAYPLPGVTYSGTDRKLALCWARALPPRPSASRSGGLEESRERPRSLPAEPAVRPKEPGAKRKGLGEGIPSSQRGPRRLSAEGGDKALHKMGPGGGKAKALGGAGSGGKGSAGGGSKQRLSSEDSSLEPDLAEMSLDDSSLALGAEASTFGGFPESPPPCPSSGGSRGPSAFLPEPPDTYEEDGGVYFSEGPEPPTVSAGPPGLLAGEVCTRDDLPSTDESGSGLPKTKEAAPTVGEEDDDYQAYYLNAQDGAGGEEEKAEGGAGEEHDLFAGLKPLEQESRMEVLFACAEALHAHGYSSEASRLTVELAQDLLANPPDLKVEPPPAKGKKNKVSTSRQTWVATNTLTKAAFLLTVLSERPEHHNLAFRVGMFALELQRPPASTKALEVKLAYQESEVAALLKKIPLGPSEMSTMRCRAEELREGTLCDFRPVLPLMLASFIFDVLCAPVVSPTGSRPPSRNWNNEMPGDEELGFEAAVAALGMKTTVSEAEHPLLCEGTRREKGDLALALMITYKDDQAKLKKILDKLLDRESQTHKPQTLSSFYSSSRPATASQRSPSKHGGPSAPGALQPLTSGSAGSAQPGSVAGAGPGPTEGFTEKNVPESSPHSPCEGLPSEAALTPRPEGKVPSRLALGSRGGYNGRGWGSPGRPKKKHTGMASIDSSAPETTSDSSPTLSRRPLRGGWAPTSWGRGQDSDSISSSSSDSLGSSSSSGSRRASASGGARAKTVEVGRYKGRRPESHAPHVPNQPSEAAAHFYFELAKTVLIKAGGNSSTSIFTHPSSSGGHQGPHRNLHLCAFEIGLYALGLHNFVSPNWLSRTYSSHVSWITGQAMEIGSAALTILVECWDGHLTPPEVASLADRASRARDSNMVRAAAELALSCLPHAHALNPNEIQRALVQCKEQDNLMLEKACMAVEEAAKGGGVYPEVLFEVAHQWFWLYEQTAGGSSTAREGATSCSASGIRAAGEAGRGLPEGRGGPGTEPVTVAAAAVTAAATVVPVISVGSSLYPGPGLGHGHSPGLHPYTALQPHLPCSPQYLTHPAHPAHPMPHMPRPAVFPVPSSAYPQGVHPAFLGAQYPYSVTPPSLAATAVSFPVPSMAPITVHPYHTEPGLPLPTSVALSSVHPASTFPAIQGASLPALTTQPSPLVSGGFPPPEEETHSQPVNPHSLHHLHAAYRVGMLALEMLGRRAHNDHPNNFSRSPPYTDDVKWLLGLAAKLGDRHGDAAAAEPCSCPQPPACPGLPPTGAALPAGIHAVHPPPLDSPDPCRLRRLCECDPQCPQRLLPDTHGHDAVQRHPAEPQAQQADQGAMAAGFTGDDHLLSLSLATLGPYTGTQACGYGGPSHGGSESWLDRSSPPSSLVAQTGSCSWAIAWGQDVSDPRSLGLGETALSGRGRWVASGIYLAFINI